MYEIHKDFWPYVIGGCQFHVIGKYKDGGYAVYKPVFDMNTACDIMRKVEGSFLAKTSEMKWTDVPAETVID